MIDDGSMMLAGSVEGVRDADFADIGSESHSKCLLAREWKQIRQFWDPLDVHQLLFAVGEARRRRRRRCPTTIITFVSDQSS